MNIEQYNSEIQAIQSRLFNHNIYYSVNTMQRLRWFMEDHVFAVWDFMSLVKRLQRELTCIDLPWVPASESARFINEIVCGEESDVIENGKSMSHLQMYLLAMEEIGADTGKFKCMLDNVYAGKSIESALQNAGAPTYIKKFVCRTIDLAVHGQTVQVASDFLYGREDAIPEMFQRILTTQQFSKSVAPTFSYYLQRHIELDSDEHGPAAQKMLTNLIGDNQDKQYLATQAAIQAIETRIELWDSVMAKIHFLEEKQANRSNGPRLRVIGGNEFLAAS